MAPARSNLDRGVIGNAAVAALADPRATMVWMRAPRMDGDPVSCRLLRGDADDLESQRAKLLDA